MELRWAKMWLRWAKRGKIGQDKAKQEQNRVRWSKIWTRWSKMEAERAKLSQNG